MAEQYKRPYLDSCVWIDFLQGNTRDHPARASIARDIFSGAEEQLFQIVASPLVVAEVIRDPTLDDAKVRDFGTTVSGRASYGWTSPSDWPSPRDIARRHRVKPPDAIHVATALRGNADCLLTSNTDDLPPGNYDGLAVTKPYYPYEPRLPLAD